MDSYIKNLESRNEELQQTIYKLHYMIGYLQYTAKFLSSHVGKDDQSYAEELLGRTTMESMEKSYADSLKKKVAENE